MSENAEQEKALAPAERRSIEDWVNQSYRGSVITIVILSAIYALSPVDALPDIVPVIGQIDDIATLIAGSSSVAFLTAMRPFAVYIAKRPVLRAGCITVIVITGIMMLVGALAVFYGIYLLIDAL